MELICVHVNAINQMRGCYYMELKVGYTNSSRYECLEDLTRSSVDLYLSYCGMEDVESGFQFGPYIRTEYVIHCVTKGKGIFRCGDDVYELTENMAFLIYPGIETIYKADQDTPWSYAWIGFNGTNAYQCVTNTGFTPRNPVLSIARMDILLDCIHNILDAHQLTYANKLKRSCQLMRFLGTLIEDHSPVDSEGIKCDYSSTIYVNQAIDYMSKNYYKKIKITDMANHIGINRSYLTTSFKRTLNMSPQEFLVTLRMHKAVSLLMETTLPVNTIAIQVGYDDPLAFSKIFKKKYGVSPKTFRETPEELIHCDKKYDYHLLRSL